MLENLTGLEVGTCSLPDQNLSKTVRIQDKTLLLPMIFRQGTTSCRPQKRAIMNTITIVLRITGFTNSYRKYHLGIILGWKINMQS